MLTEEIRDRPTLAKPPASPALTCVIGRRTDSSAPAARCDAGRRAHVGLMVYTCSSDVSRLRRFGVIGFVTGLRWSPSFGIYGALPSSSGRSSRPRSRCSSPCRSPSDRAPGDRVPACTARWPRRGPVDLLAAVPSVVLGAVGPARPRALPATDRAFDRGHRGESSHSSGPTPGPSYFAAGRDRRLHDHPHRRRGHPRGVRGDAPSPARGRPGPGGTRWDVIRQVVLPIGRTRPPGRLGPRAWLEPSARQSR